MPYTPPAAMQLWGAILIKNKLVKQERWDECVTLYKQAGGKLDIGECLQKRGYLNDKGVDVVGKKVAELLEKHKTVPAPAAAAGNPGAHAAAAPPAAAKPATAPPTAARGASTATAAPPSKPAVAAAKADTGEIALATDDGHQVAGWRPSDAEWVEAEDAADPNHAHATTLTDVERIDLVDEGEVTKGPSKIIRDERPYMKAPTKPSNGAPAAKANVLKPATAPGEVEMDDGTRVESPVVPLDLDAEAFELLRQAVKMGASDLHLASGSSPFVRLHGALKFFDFPKLTPECAQRMSLGFMTDAQQQRYLKHHDLDFAYENEELGRFRVNALDQFRGPDIIFRIIPGRVPTLEELTLPASLERFTEWHQGLVLVTGSAGSGKTTTAAALLNIVNQKRKDHIITVEDPIEFIHQSKGCNVTQRQVPNHTQSFSTALKGALREDPDVIMIGEMRDLETVSLAIRAAETGHLVIGTLQTKSAARTIDRVIDVFPADQQAQIRTMLSESLRGVISQQLIPRADGKGRVVALEVLHVNNAVSNIIRDSKTFQLPSLMQTGRKIGQKLMDDSIEELLQQKLITLDDAIKAAENQKRFRAPAAPATPAGAKA